MLFKVEDSKMTEDAGRVLKVRMRDDLRAAMKSGRTDEARLIRSLIAAIDNAEAPPLSGAQRATDQHRFRDGSAEVERLSLDATQLRAVLLTEIRERESAAEEFMRLARVDRADVLLGEAQLARRYVV